MKTIKISEDFQIPGTNIVVEKGDKIRIRVKEMRIPNPAKIGHFFFDEICPGLEKAFPSLKGILNKRPDLNMSPGRQSNVIKLSFPIDVSDELSLLFKRIALVATLYKYEPQDPGIVGEVKFEYEHPNGSNGYALGYFTYNMKGDHKFGIFSNDGGGRIVKDIPEISLDMPNLEDLDM